MLGLNGGHSNIMVEQLPLHLSLRDDATFDNYYCTSENQQAIYALSNLVNQPGFNLIYCWGAAQVGLSHLLTATCHAYHARGQSAWYLPLADHSLHPDMLSDVDDIKLICLDDIEQIAGHKAWEEALFHLFNRLKDQNGHLVVASHSSPRQCPLQLADLKSRLQWGTTYHLHSLTDTEKLKVLVQRAKQRGMHLPSSVAQFMLTHMSRDMSSLFQYLQQLEQASLIEKRRLTIPFVKSILHC